MQNSLKNISLHIKFFIELIFSKKIRSIRDFFRIAWFLCYFDSILYLCTKEYSNYDKKLII